MDISQIEELLAEIEEEITLIKRRFNIAHSLGDSNSAKGISATFSDQQFWRKELQKLRARKRYYTQLKAFREGAGPAPFNPSTLSTNIV
ncbi:hypothetical protein [Puniceicoccus vermicola]|uniref:Uncharacterized protein n=1 Tax=Puniceicoccus vermicola TaxID=388746 RepID=A0A7X1E4F0_9BACT|nr:hypothetical protein [Puniceicoccus vermicola]MBC2602076.1 hypothetical protein [Puniceicoccus vermicola]